MEQFELRLDPLDAEHIADDALRQDYYEALERDNAHLRATLDIANDQCGWWRGFALLMVIGTVGWLVLKAARG